MVGSFVGEVQLSAQAALLKRRESPRAARFIMVYFSPRWAASYPSFERNSGTGRRFEADKITGVVARRGYARHKMGGWMMIKQVGMLGALVLLAGCGSEAPAPVAAEKPKTMVAGGYEVVSEVTKLASVDQSTPATALKMGDKAVISACAAADGTPDAAMFVEAGDTCTATNSYMRSGRMSVQYPATAPARASSTSTPTAIIPPTATRRSSPSRLGLPGRRRLCANPHADRQARRRLPPRGRRQELISPVPRKAAAMPKLHTRSVTRMMGVALGACCWRPRRRWPTRR